MWLGALFLGVALSGCATTRPPLNQPLPSGRSGADYHLHDLRAASGNSDSLVVILTFSGGGTRAAAFAYGVLSELKDTPIRRVGATTTLLDETDVVAGVSGGSVTAAYFVAFGDEIFRTFEPDFLKSDFQGTLMARTRTPGSALQLSSPWFGRSHLLAEHFDQTLFRGTTFGDLAARGTRPFLLITATDLTLGSGFEFSQDQFDLLCSRFDRVPLAVAVAASSAVPLVLSPITVRNYAAKCTQPLDRQHRLAAAANPRVAANADAYLDSEKRPFVHLVDGGLSDNLAMRWIMENIALADGIDKPIERNGFRDVDKLVIISVNAEQGLDFSLDRSDRVPSIPEVLEAVASATLARRSRETREQLASSTARWREKLRRAAQAGSRALSPFVDLYVIDASLQAHPDAQMRRALEAVPTTFSLPSDDVDSLIAAGRTILRGSDEFGRLLRDLAVQQRKPNETH